MEFSIKQCFHILTNVFGPEEKELINKFSIMIKSYFSNQIPIRDKEKIQKIRVYDFLFLLCQEYHQNKIENQKKQLIYLPQKQMSFEKFKNIDSNSDLIIEKSEKTYTTTKNLKTEFDNIYNEMKAQNLNNSQYEDEINQIKNSFINYDNNFVLNTKQFENDFQDKVFSDCEKQILLTLESNLSE